MPGPGRDRWIADEWGAAFARSIEDMTGQQTTFDISSLEAAAISGDSSTVWKRQNFDIRASCPLWIGALAATRSEIGTVILKAAGIDDADADTIDGTFTEILGQAFGTLTRSISASIGAEVKLTDTDASAPAGSFSGFSIRVAIGSTSPGAVLLVVSTPLAEGVEKVGDRSPQAAHPVESAAAGDAEGGHKSRQFDLLLDVELPVSVSFGRAQLALKDVIKLTTGSIVELNRAVSEPVDVIVNNCVIARGEVVVVEGNFGVRIHQVVSRQERLRTLR